MLTCSIPAMLEKNPEHPKVQKKYVSGQKTLWSNYIKRLLPFHSSCQLTIRMSGNSNRQCAPSGRKSYLGHCTWWISSSIGEKLMGSLQNVLGSKSVFWEMLYIFLLPLILLLPSSWTYKTIFELLCTGYSPFLQQTMFPVLQGTVSPTRLRTFAKPAIRKHSLDLLEDFHSCGNSWEVVLLGL